MIDELDAIEEKISTCENILVLFDEVSIVAQNNYVNRNICTRGY